MVLQLTALTKPPTCRTLRNSGRLRVMAARAGAEQEAYEAPTWLATRRILIWIQTLTARDSLTSVTPIARTRTKRVHHTKDTEAESTKENQRNQGNMERKGVTDPRHLATLRVRPALTLTPMTRHHAQRASASTACFHGTCAMGHPATLGRNKMAAHSASTMPT